MNITIHPNSQLDVVKGNKPNWNLPENRRSGFHNLYKNTRYGMSLRSDKVLTLEQALVPEIGCFPGVKEFTDSNIFSAMIVANGQSVLYEKYAKDFSSDQPHSIQSITKLTVNLIMGDLITRGSIDVDLDVGHYLPEIGSGYYTARIQDVLDMNIQNDYSEDYADVNASSYMQESTIGWRIPPENELHKTQFEFLCGIESTNIENKTGYANYKSANTDVLAWIAERVSGRPLRHWLLEIVAAAGFDAALHISTDRDGFPVVDGGGCLTARDLARFGLLFARKGEGVCGRQVGNRRFIEETVARDAPMFDHPREKIKYSNQAFSDGTWIGHSGYGGQFLLANLETGTVCAFLSVLENESGYDPVYSAQTMEMLGKIAAEVTQAG